MQVGISEGRGQLNNDGVHVGEVVRARLNLVGINCAHLNITNNGGIHIDFLESLRAVPEVVLDLNWG
jgi:hypothetical protein